MNTNALWITGLLILTSCTSMPVPPQAILENLDENVYYAFFEYADTCNINTGNDVDTLGCSGNYSPSFTLYDNSSGNWSVACCDFNNQCSDVTNTDPDNLTNQSTDIITLYTYYEDNTWKAVCGNSNGGSLFIDTALDPSNSSTVCDGAYTENLVSVTYNATWQGVTCTGGIDR